MSKRRFKLILWALLLLAVMAAAGAAVSGAANLLAYFERGADPAAALNIIPNVPPNLHVKLTWNSDDADPGRQVDPLTRTQIGAAYLRAWLQWDLSYIKGEPYGLKTYFAGPALAAAGDAVTTATAGGLRIEQTDTTHQLTLHFYSADGAVVAFTDHDVVVAQVIRDAAGAELYAGETRADYDVVMFLEDGNWRVRHWLRREASQPESLPAAVPPARPGFVTRAGKQLLLDGQPFYVAGLDYYPRNTPWDRFWANYNPAETDRDLTLMRSLGMNTVRTFVPFEQFGGAKLDPAMADKLADFLDRADANHLKVLLTLFDFRTDYRPLLWTESDRQLEALLTRFRDHPAVLAWDMKNEPNNDYGSNGSATVDAWLGHTARLARSYDPNHLITIGWLTPAAASNLADLVDFVSFHFFERADGLAEQYAELRAAVPDRPIVMSEFGLPTWNSAFFPNGHTEAEQASYYAAILATIRATDSAGYAAWTLHDFSYVPRQVTGGSPWRIGPELQLGVVRPDGTLKPAAALLRPGAALDVAPEPAWARWLKPFWLLMFALALGLAGVAVWWLGRVWRRRRAAVRLAHPPIGAAPLEAGTNIALEPMPNSAPEVPLASTDPGAGAQSGFEGYYRSERGILIVEPVRGSIGSPKYIDVARGALVEGELSSEMIRVAGEVCGIITCARLEVASTGRIRGQVLAGELIRHAGSRIEGEVQIYGQPALAPRTTEE